MRLRTLERSEDVVRKFKVVQGQIEKIHNVWLNPVNFELFLERPVPVTGVKNFERVEHKKNLILG